MLVGTGEGKEDWEGGSGLVVADPESLGQGQAIVQRTKTVRAGRIGHAGSRSAEFRSEGIFPEPIPHEFRRVPPFVKASPAPAAPLTYPLGKARDPCTPFPPDWNERTSLPENESQPIREPPVRKASPPPPQCPGSKERHSRNTRSGHLARLHFIEDAIVPCLRAGPMILENRSLSSLTTSMLVLRPADQACASRAAPLVPNSGSSASIASRSKR